MTKKSLAGMATACPCRAGDDSNPAPLSYAECCEPWHVGSRYSAYALAQPGYQRGPDLLRYLQNTWHSSTVPIDLELSPSHWLRLQVMDAQTVGNAGVVEFVAIYKVNGKAHRLHETSRFVRSDDGARWVYIDGEG
jgi:SEC-C motif domain protein